MDVNHRDVEGNTPLYASLLLTVCLHVHVFAKSWYVHLTCITTKEIKWTVHECYKIESREIMLTYNVAIKPHSQIFNIKDPGIVKIRMA